MTGPKPRSLAATRGVAVAITFGVGAASFALSFAALRDLATRGHVPAQQAWLWPLMVDGTIMLATLGVVVMAGDPRCARDRGFFWGVLAGGALVSIACNALHATLPLDEPLNVWLRGFLAGVAPTALVVSTHCLQVLTRLHRHGTAATPHTVLTAAPATTAHQPARTGHVPAERPVDTPSTPVTPKPTAATTPEPASPPRTATAQPSVPAGAAQSTANPGVPQPATVDGDWHTAAERVLQQVSLRNIGTDEVADVLRLSYAEAVPNREIGRRLGISHHTVGKVVNAVAGAVA
ncbi:DUF2637 domain-containing protein [Mycobacterium sp. M1]|uniref:DUF2637 domain-containing protein n=1 Tax=Mycolicibacter acidiphilus TaxID=2835306 RepID=A0ABS5RNY8_9MYCO|nr:DUF2637 domain-containing protein [Mycolicibacter acidiphilus]MBS9535931.1 DUF2637 domain-containing protein [Mycolicibacter acidiphilus]